MMWHDSFSFSGSESYCDECDESSLTPFFWRGNKKSLRNPSQKGGNCFCLAVKKYTSKKSLKFLRNPRIKGSSLICLIHVKLGVAISPIYHQKVVSFSSFTMVSHDPPLSALLALVESLHSPASHSWLNLLPPFPFFPTLENVHHFSGKHDKTTKCNNQLPTKIIRTKPWKY